MLQSALTIIFLAVVGPAAAAAASQLAPDAPATAPTGSTGRSSPFELGVRLLGIALDGELVAVQQMLTLGQARAAGGSASDDSGESSPVSPSVVGTVPSSALSGTGAAVVHLKVPLRPRRMDQQQAPIEQQIKAARVSLLQNTPSSRHPNCSQLGLNRVLATCHATGTQTNARQDTIALFTAVASHVRTLNMALAPALTSNGTNTAASAAIERALVQQQDGQVARAALLANLTGRADDDAPLLQRFADNVRGAIDATDTMLRLVGGGAAAPG
jgi:hypothetical protein